MNRQGVYIHDIIFKHKGSSYDALTLHILCANRVLFTLISDPTIRQ